MRQSYGNKNYLSETGLATLWSQINKKCSKYLTEIPVATSTTIGGVKSGEGLSLSTDGTLSVVKEVKTSLELSINPNSWVGDAAPYTVGFSTSASFDPVNHTIIVSHLPILILRPILPPITRQLVRELPLKLVAAEQLN